MGWVEQQIFSSGETSRTQDSSNCSVGRGGGSGGGGGIGDSCGGVSGGGGSVGGVYSATRLMYVNERSGKQQDAKQQQQLQQQQADYKAKARRIQRGTFSECLGLLSALHNFIC